MRAAIQAYQLKQAIRFCLTKLIWLASDWNLGDALTKKKGDCRDSLTFFLRHRTWRLKFDPNFIVSAKKQRQPSRTTPSQVIGQRIMNSKENFGDAVHELESHEHEGTCEFMFRMPGHLSAQ